MPILRNVPYSLTAETLLEAEGRGRDLQRQQAFKDTAEQAIEMGRPLFAPAAIYDEFEVRGLAGHRVELAPDGAGLTLGPKADLLAPAKTLFVAVYTIGPALEARVSELYDADEALLSYMLDCVGVMALGLVGETMHRLVEEKAAQRGWGVSAALSPGSLVGWPVQGQRQLCALLPLEEIGVQLTPYCVLEPHKSVSMVIGLGPDYQDHQVGSVCHYCALQESCWRRRETVLAPHSPES